MEITRKNFRYWCYRKQTELEGGAKAEGFPQEIEDHLKSKKIWDLTGGFINFSRTWDISDPKGERSAVDFNDAQPGRRVLQDVKDFDIEARSEPIQNLWNEHLSIVAKEMPRAEKKVKKVERSFFKQKGEQDVELNLD